VFAELCKESALRYLIEPDVIGSGEQKALRELYLGTNRKGDAVRARMRN